MNQTHVDISIHLLIPLILLHATYRLIVRSFYVEMTHLLVIMVIQRRLIILQSNKVIRLTFNVP